MSEKNPQSDRNEIFECASIREHDLSRREVLGLMGGGLSMAILGTGFLGSSATMAQDHSVRVTGQADGVFPALFRFQWELA